MLTFEQSRKILNDPTLTDEEIAEIREAHQALAEIIYEQWLRDRKREQATRRAVLKNGLPANILDTKYKPGAKPKWDKKISPATRRLLLGNRPKE